LLPNGYFVSYDEVLHMSNIIFAGEWLHPEMMTAPKEAALFDLRCG
jgi:hypothetical protein